MAIPGAPSRTRSPFSLARVDAAIARCTAGAGLFLILVALPSLLDQRAQFHTGWAIAAPAAIAATILTALVASIVSRWIRPAFGAVAVVYLAVLLSWPLAVADPALVGNESNWLYYLLAVAIAAVAIVAGVVVAAVYLVVVPLLYALIRISEAGGGVSMWLAVLDSVYCVIFGTVVIVLLRMLRRASARVDSAQAAALERYSLAVRRHAAERERVRIDGLVHDSVLTTLLAAADARTSEATALAVQMAERSLRQLDDVVDAPYPQQARSVEALAARLRDAAAAMVTPLPFTARIDGEFDIPAQLAEALSLAAVQAMTNSVQHAGDGAPRRVALESTDSGSITIVVADRGRGFDPDAVEELRLGMRVSITERVTKLGGAVAIDSARGQGTTVTLSWAAAEIPTDRDSPPSPQTPVSR